MSFDAFVWAWDQPLAKDEHLIVLLALANIANENHEVYAGQPYIAAMARKEERTVRRALVAMMAMDPPPILVRARPGTTDVITLNIPEEFTVRRRRPEEAKGKRGRPPKSLVAPDAVAENPGHGGGKPPSMVSDEPIEGTSKGTTSPKGAVARPRGRFVPDDWQPNHSHEQKALSLGLTEEQAKREHGKFRNHEFDKPKSDWDRAFHNWLDRAAGDYSKGNGYGPGSTARPNPALERSQNRLRNLQAGIVAAVGGDGGPPGRAPPYRDQPDPEGGMSGGGAGVGPASPTYGPDDDGGEAI